MNVTSAWFNTARFGMFVHWGHSAQQGIELSWPLVGGVFALPESKPVPVDQYHSSAATFDPQNWDARQLARQGVLNSQLDGRALRLECLISDAGDALLGRAVKRLSLSARAMTRVLRVSRTIADLDGHADIMPEHVSEAVNYRMLDRQFWS